MEICFRTARLPLAAGRSALSNIVIGKYTVQIRVCVLLVQYHALSAFLNGMMMMARGFMCNGKRLCSIIASYTLDNAAFNRGVILEPRYRILKFDSFLQHGSTRSADLPSSCSYIHQFNDRMAERRNFHQSYWCDIFRKSRRYESRLTPTSLRIKDRCN